jgi:negative regulator of flagellin synthesis FlgM
MRVSQSGNNPQTSEVNGRGKVNHTSAANNAKKTEKAAEASQSSRAVSTGDANAEISSKGKEFAKAKAIASDAPDVREEKIAALKARIAEGKYKVDADAIADRMVDEHIHMQGIG